VHSSPVDPELMMSALDQAPLILMVCEGPDLIVAGFSAALKALIPDREAMGRPLADVFHELDSQGLIPAYEQAYRTGQAVAGQEWRVHIDLPDGSVREMYANFSITPWLWPGGRLRGVIGTGIDVTDMVRARVDAENQARHLRERYEQTLDVVTALQQELLPPGVPVLPGARLAASYLLADAGTAAGGDWFDAVAQPGGRVALIIGDVVGHGVAASGVMGQLRAVLQDRLDGGAGIAEALAAADRTTRRMPQRPAAPLPRRHRHHDRPPDRRRPPGQRRRVRPASGRRTAPRSGRAADPARRRRLGRRPGADAGRTPLRVLRAI
jgi:hypothetical protein